MVGRYISIYCQRILSPEFHVTPAPQSFWFLLVPTNTPVDTHLFIIHIKPIDKYVFQNCLKIFATFFNMPKGRNPVSRQKRRIVTRLRANVFNTNGTIIVCKLTEVNRF